MKSKIAQDTLLQFPNFKKTLNVYTDASNLQIGGTVVQDGHPVGFFSRKFNIAQRKYTATDQ